jgi:hypothetical protein
MPLEPYSQDNNQYTPGGYEKAKLRKLLLIVAGVFAVILLITVVNYVSQSQSQQSKYTRSATTAARKQIPNAKVKDVKVAGGFALAIVSDPDAEGQSNAGNITVFKVYNDGSMRQLANGSSFGPIDLLALGMPLATQAKLTGSGIGQVKQNLKDQCGYNDGAPGFSGFDGTFSPGGWQIDELTLSILEKDLSFAVSNQDINARPGKAVVCVNAIQRNSNVTTDPTTYVSTFTLQAQFITEDGTISKHTVTFTIGSNSYRSYTLDGHDI